MSLPPAPSKALSSGCCRQHLRVLTLKVKSCPSLGLPPPKSPLAVNSCTREGPITHNTDAHSGPAASGPGQTEPAPSPRSTGPSWSPALCPLGSGNLCELWRRGHAGELGNSGDGPRVFYQVEATVPTCSSSLWSHQSVIYIYTLKTP